MYVFYYLLLFFTVYTDLLRMQRLPAELLLTTGGTPKPHIHNTEAAPGKVSLHMKIHTLQYLLYEYDMDRATVCHMERL